MQQAKYSELEAHKLEPSLVPAAVMAATNEATPAPVASANPGEGGTGEGGTSWITETPTPAESLVPVALGGVVLVILVVLIATTSANPSET